jgi:hypothetical protein
VETSMHENEYRRGLEDGLVAAFREWQNIGTTQRRPIGRALSRGRRRLSSTAWPRTPAWTPSASSSASSRRPDDVGRAAR